MTDPLLGARLKVERARQHLETLRHETRVFTEGEPYRFVTERDPDTGDHVVRLRVSQPDIPLRLGLIAGDAVHNLRSALDHLAVQLADIGTGAKRSTQFPVFDDEHEYRLHQDRTLAGIVKGHRARIDALQPYHVRERVDRGVYLTGRTDPLLTNLCLMIVARLDNADKHRLLLRAVGMSRFEQPKFIGVKRATGTYRDPWVRMDDGAELFRVTEVELLPGATEMEMKANPSYTILFGDPETALPVLWSDPTKGGASRADLALAADKVQGVIDDFASEFV